MPEYELFSGAPSMVKLNGESLREQARRAIRNSIILGEMMPGETFQIGAVAEVLGVSITPVREALVDLAHEGLVRVRRNRGFEVSKLNEEDLDELVDLRLLIEPPLIRRLAKLISEEELAEARRAALRTIQDASDGNLIQFLESDRAFHLALIEHTGNRRALEIVGRLRDQTRLYGLKWPAFGGGRADSADEHLAIVEALSNRDGKAAEKLMRSHLEHLRVRPRLDDQPSGPRSRER